jgi:hypothetical protein
MIPPWDEPRICRGCTVEVCTRSPGECEQDAKDNDGDRRCHEARER